MKTVGRILPRITLPSRAKSTYIEADIEVVQKTLKELQSSKLDANADFDSVNRLINGLGSISLITGTLMPGACIMRTRCEIGSLYETIKNITLKAQLSYRPDHQNVGIGRANLACEPLFYGCLFNHNGKQKDIFARAATACFAETRRDAMRQTMVAGVWRVTKPISYSIVVQRAELMKANALIRQSLSPKYRLFRGDHRETEASRLVTNFFAELYSQPVEQGEEHKYVLGACFAMSLFLQGLDSLVYSSIAAGGSMPNIAILPEVVDEALELIMVRAIDMRKTGIASHSEVEAYAATPTNSRWFKDKELFNWHPHTDLISIRQIRA
jgi:hypothetical protein